MKKKCRVWSDDTDIRILWLTDSEIVEYRHAGFYVREE